VIKILGWTTLSIWQGVVPKLISAAPPESSATITTLTLATRLGATCMLPVVRPVAWLSVRNAIFRCPLHTYRGISQVLTFSVWIAAIMYRITAINPQILALFALPCTDRLPLRTLRLCKRALLKDNAFSICIATILIPLAMFTLLFAENLFRTSFIPPRVFLLALSVWIAAIVIGHAFFAQFVTSWFPRRGGVGCFLVRFDINCDVNVDVHAIAKRHGDSLG